MGRPLADIKEQDVYDLAGFGCTNEEIAAHLGVSADTIVNRFSEAIKKGKLEFYSSLRRLQARSAKGYWEEDKETGKRVFVQPSVPMQIWLGKQYLNQVDKNEISGKDGEAFKLAVEILTPPKAEDNAEGG